MVVILDGPMNVEADGSWPIMPQQSCVLLLVFSPQLGRGVKLVIVMGSSLDKPILGNPETPHFPL